MRHPASLVLDALLLGMKVELGRYNYKLVDDVLYIVGRRRIGNEPEEEVLLAAPHMTVSQLVEQAKTLTQGDLALIAGDIVLNRLARESVQDRLRWQQEHTNSLPARQP